MAPALKHLKFSEIEIEEVNPLLGRQMVTGEQIMLTRIFLKRGCVVPEHSHFNEQVSYILEGSMQFTIEGKDIIVGTGEVLCIPPDLPHSALALEDCVSIDVFSPPRADWLNGSDAYLKQANRT